MGLMFEGADYWYLRGKINLENKLTESVETNISTEIKSQMIFVEERLVAKIKQAYKHSTDEMNGLKMTLIESSKVQT